LRPLDVLVLAGTLAVFVAYGLWRSRATRDLPAFLVAGRSMRWPVVALSVMATQASAVTFLATPGQGYAGGLSFVQFYFGLPLAMVVLCLTAVPLYQRLRVATAYEFLERRFDGNVRSLAAGLFLLQRGLAAGITLLAPAIVLSVVLGWDLRWTCLLLGALVVGVTTLGGSKAIAQAHALQFTIIIGAMTLAFVLALQRLPEGVGPGDALAVAGHLGRLNAVDTHFDPRGRYNLWAGIVGGLFLQLSYFGTDQSQVGRYLAGSSVAQSRMGLIANGLLKVPMQFFVLLLGVLVFVVFQFERTPLFFDPTGAVKASAGPGAARWRELEGRHDAIGDERARALRDWLAARRAGDATAAAVAEARVKAETARDGGVRDSALAVLRATDPAVNTNDTNYVFLRFVLASLPAGVVGLVLAAIFAASMNSTSSEIHALTSTTIVDVVRRIPGAPVDEARMLAWTRAVNVFWILVASLFAQFAGRSGSLVETVNQLGSLFYGTILGIFLCAFFVRRAGGPAVFTAALVAEALVIACWKLDLVFWLWFNVVGSLVTVALAAALAALVPAWRAKPAG
jgi:Na+/proline symporter